jgi:ribosome-associated protein
VVDLDAPDPGDEPVYDGPSKSQRKREMLDLQALGERLATLGEERLASLGLPERLVDAVRQARRLTKHGALRRQRQYIGRLMRDVDAGPIQEAFDRWDGLSKADIAREHRAERWRERLLAEPDALTAFAGAHPGVDLQRIRTLIRNAQSERSTEKPPRSYRELFRLIRELQQPAFPGGDTNGNAGEPTL